MSAFEAIISFVASSSGGDAAAADEVWGAGATSPRERPAGSRRDAEAATPEASDRRRARWRHVLFEEIWREHMPFGFVPDAARRASFAQSLEVAVRAFAGGSAADAAEADEQSEEARLRACSNREVLTAEQADLRLHLALLRQRMRSLEEQSERAEAKAAMWRGASPSSEADRMQAMQRELDYLELARRLRSRLASQRADAQRCDELARAVQQRLDSLRDSRYAPGFT